MAGLGTRFTREGYKESKPLIEVSGKPMFIQAINHLPKFKNQVIIVREDMSEFKRTKNIILSNLPNASIKEIPGITSGQALTTLEGVNTLKLNGNNYESVTVSACDNGYIFNLKEFNKYLINDDVDIIVWGAENYTNAKRNPEMYGWIDNTKEGFIKKVSVKKSINSDFTKPIITGTFTFKSGKKLKMIIEKLIEDESNLVNGEFYLDSCINTAIKLGMKCKYFKVDYYICWGTPNDLKTFEYWQSCFHKWNLHPYKIENDKNIPKSRINFLKNKFLV